MKINSIQYLRAFAAVLVVYAHCLNFIGKGNSIQANFYFLKSFGAIGVDLFFVISGFIITYVSFNLKGYTDFIVFLKKRFIRINPTYYFASILALILRYISKPYIEFPFEEAIKSFTILPIFDFGDKVWKPILYVGWTLAFEWFFYLIFALLIVFSVNKKHFYLILILGILTLTGYLFPLQNIQYKFITNPIVWEFCMGVLIAQYYKKYNVRKSISLVVLITGLLIYALIILNGYGIKSEANSNNNEIYYWYRFCIWGIPSALIVWGAVFIEKNGANYFNNKILLLIGNASFAIYLVHTLFISLVNKFFHLLKFIPLDFCIILSVVISVFIGILYYLWIEQPLAKYFNQLVFNKNRS